MCSGSSWRRKHKGSHLRTHCFAVELTPPKVRWGQLPASPTAGCRKKCCSLSSDIWPSPDCGWCDLWRGAARDAPPCRRSGNNSATAQRSQTRSVCYSTRCGVLYFSRYWLLTGLRMFRRGSHPAAVALHQIELYSLNAAIMTACIDLGETKTTVETSFSAIYIFPIRAPAWRVRFFWSPRTTLLCTAMHITMLLCPPYTCRQSCDWETNTELKWICT